ncbi:MAG: hypothetical protein JZU65_14550 [Chlorobium sp.]|jgi:hypothetical protein|nr:hypothetical protein [Chlorobium sp.]
MAFSELGLRTEENRREISPDGRDDKRGVQNHNHTNSFLMKNKAGYRDGEIAKQPH